MKITDIRCYVMGQETPPPRFRWRTGLAGDGDGTPVGQPRYTSIVRIDTDAGVVGRTHVNGKAIADIVARRFKSLVGLDPMLTEQLWHEVWEIDRLEEIPLRLLGAVDIACWDIKAQVAGLPLYRLLGGNSAKVPAYASTVTFDTMDDYERMIKTCRDVGFTAFKLHAWGDWRQDAALSRNLRKWVGDEADLMFDGSAGWDYVTSLRFGRVLEEVDFLWYEEPMREFDLPSYTQLCADLDIAVLGAETSDGCHWNAATWIQHRALDMVRTNCGYKGGVTGALKIAHLAESFGMRAQVHGDGWPNAHLCAAIINNDYFEKLVINEAQIRGLANDPQVPVVEGYITVPETPGIYPPLDWDEIEKQAVEIT